MRTLISAIIFCTLLPAYGAAESPCQAAMIDIAGWHAYVVADVYRYESELPISQFTMTVVQDVPALIDQAVACGARVINFSLALADDPALRAAVDRAFAADVLIVGAAGNQGPSHAPAYPGAYPGAISVGAIQGLSNRADISATGPSTSIAAPHVSGIAAKLRARYPDLRAPAIRAILIATMNEAGELNPSAATRAAAVSGRDLVFIPAICLGGRDAC